MGDSTFIAIVLFQSARVPEPQLEFGVWASPSLRRLGIFLCLAALRLHPSGSFGGSSHLPSCPPTMTPYPPPRRRRRPSPSLSFIVCLPLSISPCRITPSPHSSWRLAITAYLLSVSLSLSPSSPSPSYLSGNIGSAVRCLGLRQPVSTPKCFPAPRLPVCPARATSWSDNFPRQGNSLTNFQPAGVNRNRRREQTPSAQTVSALPLPMLNIESP